MPILKRKRKLHGKPGCELTRLKTAWREMSGGARADLLEKLLSSLTRPQLRQWIKDKLDIALEFDAQITRFRQWAQGEDEQLTLGEAIEEIKRDLLADGKSLEEIQQVLLRTASAYSLTARDFKLGLRACSEISKVQNTDLSRDRFYFAAVEECRKNLPVLRAVEADTTLSEAEKTQHFMETLFGPKPVTEPQPQLALPHAQN